MTAASYTNEPGRFPDFIVIGAQKSGTSTLYRSLSNHRQVTMASKSEVGFFSDDRLYSRGPSVYAEFFTHARNETIVGEVSPSYMYSEIASKRLRTALPNVKLVACLRNPVERAFSAWKMQISKGSETRPFHEAIRRTPQYIEYGRYYSQLAPYIESFPSQQLLVLLFDDLLSNSADFYKKLCAYLAIDFDNEMTGVKANEGGMPRHKLVVLLLNMAYRSANLIQRSNIGGHLFEDVLPKARKLRNRIATWNRDPAISAPPIDVDSAKRIVDRLSNDIDQLSRLIGRNLSHWKDIDQWRK